MSSPNKARCRLSLSYKKPQNLQVTSPLENDTLIKQSSQKAASTATEELTLGVCGIQNMGNTCYLNSVLQVLRFTPDFPEQLALLKENVAGNEKKRRLKTESQEGDKARVNTGVQEEVVKSLHCMFERMRRKECKPESELIPDRPMRLLNLVRQLNPMFEGFLQHDAQELLRCLLCYVQDAAHSIGSVATADRSAAALSPVTAELTRLDGVSEPVATTVTQSNTLLNYFKKRVGSDGVSDVRGGVGHGSVRGGRTTEREDVLEADGLSSGEERLDDFDRSLCAVSDGRVDRAGVAVGAVSVLVKGDSLIGGVEGVSDGLSNAAHDNPGRVKRSFVDRADVEGSEEQVKCNEYTLNGGVDVRISDHVMVKNDAMEQGLTRGESWGPSLEKTCDVISVHHEYSKATVINACNEVSLIESSKGVSISESSKGVSLSESCIGVSLGESSKGGSLSESSKGVSLTESSGRTSLTELDIHESLSARNNGVRNIIKKGVKNKFFQSGTVETRSVKRRKLTSAIKACVSSNESHRDSFTGSSDSENVAPDRLNRSKNNSNAKSRVLCETRISETVDVSGSCSNVNIVSNLFKGICSKFKQTGVSDMFPKKAVKRLGTNGPTIKCRAVKFTKIESGLNACLNDLVTPTAETCSRESVSHMAVNNGDEETSETKDTTTHSVDSARSGIVNSCCELEQDRVDDVVCKDLKTETIQETYTSEESTLFGSSPPKKSDLSERCDDVVKDCGGVDVDGACGRNGAVRRDLVECLFGGTMMLCTRCCDCETTSRRTEAFHDVSVPLHTRGPIDDDDDGAWSDSRSESEPEDDASDSLSRLMSAFSETERLRDDNKYFCGSCLTYVEAERSIKYDRLPRVLTLHLKRFSTNPGRQTSKINDHVATSLSLPCLRFTCHKPCLHPYHRYSLYAVISHSGVSITSGHYTAYVRVTRSSYLNAAISLYRTRLAEFEKKSKQGKDTVQEAAKANNGCNPCVDSSAPTGQDVVSQVKRVIGRDHGDAPMSAVKRENSLKTDKVAGRLLGGCNHSNAVCNTCGEHDQGQDHVAAAGSRDSQPGSQTDVCQRICDGITASVNRNCQLSGLDRLTNCESSSGRQCDDPTCNRSTKDESKSCKLSEKLSNQRVNSTVGSCENLSGVYRDDDDWLHCDDDEVTLLSAEQFQNLLADASAASCSPYVLFYTTNCV